MPFPPSKGRLDQSRRHLRPMHWSYYRSTSGSSRFSPITLHSTVQAIELESVTEHAPSSDMLKKGKQLKPGSPISASNPQGRFLFHTNYCLFKVIITCRPLKLRRNVYDHLLFDWLSILVYFGLHYGFALAMWVPEFFDLSCHRAVTEDLR